MARIAHLDVDAFYASVELLRRPELSGKPVIVSGSGPRAVVTTASYEARKFGIGSAMPTARARRLCPDAILIPPDFTAYREASGKVMALLRAHVERVEVVGLDEAYLDLDGLVAPRAAMRRLVAEIKEQTGLTASVGIGPNKLGCGGTLNTGTVGVAHKSLPCGTNVVLRKGSRIVRAKVIDRGPYVGAREFDLTAATKQRLGFGSTGTVLVAH